MWWDILGIDADSDSKQIKRSYAKLLKSIDQENEIERFSEVNNAYQEALSSIKSSDYSPEINDYSNNSQDLSSEDNTYKDTKTYQFSINNPISKSDDFLTKLTDLYIDPTRVNDINEWCILIEQMTLDDEDDFEPIAVSYFNEKAALTPDVFSFIINSFHLDSKDDFHFAFIVEDYIDLKQINNYTNEEYLFLYQCIASFLIMNYKTCITHGQLLFNKEEQSIIPMKLCMIAAYETNDLELYDKLSKTLESYGACAWSRTYPSGQDALNKNHFKDAKKHIEKLNDISNTTYGKSLDDRLTLKRRWRSPISYMFETSYNTKYIDYECDHTLSIRSFFLKSRKMRLLGLANLFVGLFYFLHLIGMLLFIVAIIVVAIPLGLPLLVIFGIYAIIKGD